MEGQEFIRRMQHRDPDLWAQLMPVLRKVTLGVCHDLRLYDEVREDIVQDVLLKVFTEWRQWRGEGKVETWAYSIARNRGLDELRRRRVRGDGVARPAERDSGEDGGLHDPEDTYHPHMDQHLCVRQMLAALDAQGEARKGSRRMADVLQFWVLHSPTTAELADFLGTTEAAAKERKSYIFKRIRELCARFCGHDECAMET